MKGTNETLRLNLLTNIELSRNLYLQGVFYRYCENMPRNQEFLREVNLKLKE